jgi:sec-independent protein translocase protein TatC
MPDRPEDVRMSIGEHIEELRRRVIQTLWCFGAIFFVTFLFHKEVRHYAVKPYEDAVRNANEVLAQKRKEKGTPAPKHRTVIFGGPLYVEAAKEHGLDSPDGKSRVLVFPWAIYGTVQDEAELEHRPIVLSPQELVFQDIKLAMLMALLFSAPMLLYQLWAFIRAGLYESERRAIAPYLPLTIGLFVAGAAFGYLYMVPLVLRALLVWGSPDEVVIQTRLQEYLSLFYTFTFSLGFIFEIPVLMMMFARIGIISAKGFLTGWRYAVLAGVVVGAVLNPAPDIVTQLLFAAPIVGLYFLGIAMSFWAERSRDKRLESSH